MKARRREREATTAPDHAARADDRSPSIRSTPERWADLQALFGERGGCGGCWCMWPRLTGREFVAGKGAGNRRAFHRLVAAGDTPGILAYVDGQVAGWCALGPRAGFRRLESSRVLAPIDDQPVWSVVCFFIARPYRRQGLTVELLREAARFAAGRGARILEGYPVEPSRAEPPTRSPGPGSRPRSSAPDSRRSLRRSETRPIMRRTVASRARG